MICIVLLVATLSGCAGKGAGDTAVTSTSDNIPLKETMDIRAGKTAWVVFEAPRDDSLQFDYELLAGDQLDICLMTTPARAQFEKGADVPCGHEDRLYGGGWNGVDAAAFTNDFDGGEYNIALKCQGSHDCAVHVRVRHNDDEYQSTQATIVGADAAFPLGSRITADLDPEREILYKFDMATAERLSFKIQDVRGNSMRACFVDAAESQRLAQDKPAKCLALQSIGTSASWEGYLDLVPDQYGLRISCVSKALAGCSYKVELSTPTMELEAIDISGDVSPNGYTATGLPHRQTFTVQGARTAYLVFGVPAGERLHYEATQASYPSVNSFTMTACLAYEADLNRLESGKPVSCLDAPTMSNSGYSKVTSWQKYRDLDQDWYTLHFKCTSQDACHFRVDLRLENDRYHDLRAAQSGKSPGGHGFVGSTHTVTDDMQPERRRSYVFQLSGDARLNFGADWIAGAGSMSICLTHEDQVNQFMDGGSVACIDTWALRSTGWSSITTVSDYHDLDADWYAVLLTTSAQSDDFSYRLAWEAS